MNRTPSTAFQSWFRRLLVIFVCLVSSVTWASAPPEPQSKNASEGATPEERAARASKTGEIGPGTRVRVTVPDVPIQVFSSFVELDGSVNLGIYGKLSVAGLDADRATQALHVHLEKFLNSTRGARVEVVEPGVLILVLGMVTQPGFVRMPWRSDVWQAIVQAGGVRKGGDLTRVQLARNGKDRVIDLRSDLVSDPERLPKLRSGDVIRVPGDAALPTDAADAAAFLGENSLRTKIFVIGEVRTPGLYDLTPSLTAPMALALAGGPNNGANLEQAYLVTPKSSEVMNLGAQLRGGQPAELPDEGGVILFIPGQNQEVSPFGSYVNVVGAVERPGRIQVPGPISVVDALAQAGGPARGVLTKKLRLISSSDAGTLVRTYRLRRFLRRGGVLSRVTMQPGDTLYLGAWRTHPWDQFVNVISNAVVLFAAISVLLGM